jgi:hypothetical protein
LSPDDRHVAVFRGLNRNIDVWSIDVARGVPTRFTFDSADDVLPVRLMAVPIRWGSHGETGAPVPLFATRVRGMPVGQTQYAVSSDGQRFLMNTLIEEVVSSPITMILNWRAESLTATAESAQ